MAIVKIYLVDAAGQPLADQTVKVTGCGALETNTEGRTQFLLEANASVDIEINGAKAWSGNSDQLTRDEKFQQSPSGFVRAAS